MPCLWGHRSDAVEGCDPDERVVRVAVEVLEVLGDDYGGQAEEYW